MLPLRRLLPLVASLLLSSLTAQTFYWYGGSGEWADPSHWSLTPPGQGVTEAGDIPNDKTAVVIDEDSGLKDSDVLTVSPGTYAFRGLTVTTTTTFTLHLAGSSSTNRVVMNNHGDLKLSEKMQLTYLATQFGRYAEWRFVNERTASLLTYDKDLLRVEFQMPGGEVTLQDDLFASQSIRFGAGTWNTAGRTVVTDILTIYHGNSQQNPLAKTLNTGGSTFRVDNWDSTFTYGSLTFSGSHRIFARRFLAAPFVEENIAFEEIHLTESDADVDGSGGVVLNDYNYRCVACPVARLIIDDTETTRLYDEVTITESLIVNHPGLTIELGGGNRADNTLTLNGTVNLPSVTGCGQRTRFVPASADFGTIYRESGTLTLTDVDIIDIKAEGGADFFVDGGIVTGNSPGWQVVNPPQGETYLWVGSGDWDDLDNWKLQSGSAPSCLPTLIDDVVIGDEADGDIRVPPGLVAQCRNFDWTSQREINLQLDGTGNQGSCALEIGGDFSLSPTAKFEGVGFHDIRFLAAQKNNLLTNGVALPDISFEGALGTFVLLSPLTCADLAFRSGKLVTSDHTVTARNWRALGTNPKVYDFGRSLIDAEDLFSAASVDRSLAEETVTILPSSYRIRCRTLYSNVDLSDVTLTGGSTSPLEITDITIDQLNVVGSESLPNQFFALTVGTLVFLADGARLRVNPTLGLTITERIVSQASAGAPARLESTSTFSAPVTFGLDYNCVSGPVSFLRIEGEASGGIHAPAGSDAGGSSGINFSAGSPGDALYWTGQTNAVISMRTNWSAVPGGCPTDASIFVADSLIFDDGSTGGEEIAVSVTTIFTTDKLVFRNASGLVNLTVNTFQNIGARKLLVGGGRVRIGGNRVVIAEETNIEDGGELTTDLVEFFTIKLTGSSGTFRVAEGANATVRQ